MNREKEEQLAYIAGWFASDGHLIKDYSGIAFQLKGNDICKLEQFSSWFGGIAKTYTSKRELKIGLVDYEIAKWTTFDKLLNQYLRSFDFKNHLIKGDPELKRLFIRGFLEGDGHVSFKKTGHFVLTFTNQSETLLNDIQEHFKDVLSMEPKKINIRKDNTYQLTYESRNARILAWYLYKDALYFLPRKAAVANKLFTSSEPIKAYLKILLLQSTEYIKHNNGFMFRLFGCKDSRLATKIACAGFKLLGVNANPITYGKGKEKYFGVYIPSSHIHILSYTQDILTECTKNTFAGKVKLKA